MTCIRTQESIDKIICFICSLSACIIINNYYFHYCVMCGHVLFSSIIIFEVTSGDSGPRVLSALKADVDKHGLFKSLQSLIQILDPLLDLLYQNSNLLLYRDGGWTAE